MLSAKPATKRGDVLGQVIFCLGCCCGRPDRGHPALPVDWIKSEWKAHKLNKKIQLTISGCLGPCDVPNVVWVHTPNQSRWFGKLSTDDIYRDLVAWAISSAEHGELLPFPPSLLPHEFERFGVPALQTSNV